MAQGEIDLSEAADLLEDVEGKHVDRADIRDLHNGWLEVSLELHDGHVLKLAGPHDGLWLEMYYPSNKCWKAKDAVRET